MSRGAPAKKAVSGLVLAVIACAIVYCAATVGAYVTAVAPEYPDVGPAVPRGALNGLYVCAFVLFGWGTLRCAIATQEMLGRRPAKPDPAARRRAPR